MRIRGGRVVRRVMRGRRGDGIVRCCGLEMREEGEERGEAEGGREKGDV
jgi:hypothetical protein